MMIYAIGILFAALIVIMLGIKLYVRHSFDQFVEQLIDFHAEESEKLFKDGYELGYTDASTDPMNVKTCYDKIYNESLKKD
jgi:hypothetical protein